VYGFRYNCGYCVFLDITPHGPLKVIQRFWGTCRLLPGRACHLLSLWFHAQLIRPQRWRAHVPRKRRLTFSELYPVASRKADLFNQERFVEETSCMGNTSAHKTLSGISGRKNPVGSIILNCSFQSDGVTICDWLSCFRTRFAGAWEVTYSEDLGSVRVLNSFPTE
jgi:hypothetical protein